jgi:hypothetical protein
MFYRKEEIDCVLACTFCSEVMTDPRILPCGASACHKCIRHRSNADNELECLFCKRKHSPIHSSSGFCPKLALRKLIETRPESVQRNRDVDELVLQLAEIKQICDKFKHNRESRVDEINEHRIKLRNQVHLQAEIRIEQDRQ